MDRIIENKSKKRRKILWISGSVLLVAFVVYQLVWADHTSKLNVDKDKLTITTIVEEDFLDYMTATGTVEPIATIYLDAIEGGRVEKIMIEEGSMVTEGDIILQLSNPDLNLRILTNQANLAEQENRLRDTKLLMEQQRIDLRRQIIQLDYDLIKLKREYNRNKTFIKKGLISEEEFLLSEDSYNLAEQTLKLFEERSEQDSIFRTTQVINLEQALTRMHDNLSLVKEKLESLNIKAPISGQLGTLNAEIGQTITTGYRVGQVNVLDSYKVMAPIDEHWIDRIKHGLLGTLDRNDKTFELSITKVYPEVRNGQFEIDMEFNNEKPENIRTGQTYRIRVELGRPKMATQVLKGGFYSTTGGQWIYVVDPSGEFATKRSISTGKMNPRYYEILDGLVAGEQVIISPYDGFGDNEKLILK
ncbi:MAG: HlyD family efflux transporter periplasmic adaptor subunit [Bacteroidetes bacterium]|jgi:HlyD family secretion protein|nr:HlyD family efflux transporter periplasmic adaptor subunit [Bacteroidota bacterium]MBT4399480.1 HlyD family efflux transporter periplasmic adaptor subunit [Bacteroidota bacterium]MBT4408559.1 HlyD family efflux transporter periplasmic adaptor subunit [Bacteroidota bacterium]MBT5426072.1 HlyD family efflux transporter periplasmic adaptor subunit [Bacteroidota bacterium]MBT7094308.1 HlyD family efflux transporter periplasmic adaptor subunit [Bacteroidota bacterium]